MAGEWIPMRADLAMDPAVVSIARATKLDPDAVVGKLHRLWSWAGQQTADGYLPGIDEKWIDDMLRKKGFASAMTVTPLAPWLVVDPSGVTIPNFQRWLGSSAKSRMSNTLRQQKARHKRDTAVTNVTEKARPEENTYKLPPPPIQGLSPSGSLGPGWAEVEGILFSEGVAKARELCIEAEKNGCNAMQIKNLITYYISQKPAWGAGALHDRAMQFRPGQQFVSLWPARSPDFVRDSAEKKAKEVADKRETDRAQSRRRSELERAEVQILESQFGGILQEMPRADLLEMIREAFPAESAMYESLLPPKGPPAGMLRGLLLRELERADLVTNAGASHVQEQ